MPSHVPVFTFENYLSIMDAEYSSADGFEQVSIWEAIATVQSPLTTTYADLDARELSVFISKDPIVGNTYFNENIQSTQKVLTNMKLLFPTLRCCDYFYRNIGKGNHTGIDIILPKNTSIISFTDGKVVRVKTRDGTTTNEGNCIAIQSTDGYVVGYEHLERIDVTLGQQVTQGEVVGLCGSTGNSTQYHLHLQVDKSFAPFHPYWSRDIKEIQKHTIDPLPYLRARSPKNIYRDAPSKKNYNDAIQILTKGFIIQGFNRHIYPENNLQRYQAALIIDRMMRLYGLYSARTIVTPLYTEYVDTMEGDTELDQALIRLQKYGIMKGSNNSFEPKKELSGEQLLALVGRIFYGLHDNLDGKRYALYFQFFIQQGIIDSDWGYIEKSIPRKEVFLLLAEVLKREKIL